MSAFGGKADISNGSSRVHSSLKAAFNKPSTALVAARVAREEDSEAKDRDESEYGVCTAKCLLVKRSLSRVDTS